MTDLIPLRHVTSSLTRGLSPNYIDDGPIRVVNQAANQLGGIDWERAKFHDFTGNPKYLRGLLQRGDVLVNSTGTGTLGRIGWFEGSPDSRPCIADGHVTMIRFDPVRMDGRFGFYYLTSSSFQELMFETMVSGSTNQIELSRERMRAASVRVPPLEEQRCIADFLDAETARMRDMMRMRARSVHLAEERFESQADELLWRFSETVSLKWVAEGISVGVVVNPSTYVEDGAPIRFFRGVDVESFSLNVDDAQRISRESNHRLKKSILRAGDVVSVRVGDPGVSAVVPECADGSNCASVLIIRRTSKMNSQLLCHILNSRHGRRQWSELSVGAAQKQVNVSAVGNFQIPMLTHRRQETTTERLEAARLQLARMKSLEHQQANLLAERRDALITAAVTGQFDVTTASPTT